MLLPLLLACDGPLGAKPSAHGVDDTAVLPTDSVGDTDTDTDTDTGCATPSTWYVDADGDGWGSTEPVEACEQPPGTAAIPGDCNDRAPSAHPGGVEFATDGLDGDCDGVASASRIPSVHIWAAPDDRYMSRVTLTGDLTGAGGATVTGAARGFEEADGSWSDGGVVYVFPAGVVAGASGDAAPWATLRGTGYDRLHLVVDVGDLDGDGRDDLAVSGDGTAGEPHVTYIVRGIPAGESSLPDLAPPLTSLEYNDYLQAVAGWPDRSGDGLPEVVLAAERANSYAGAVYVLEGPAEHTSVADAELILTSDEREEIGDQTRATGDVDGDGLADLAISAGYNYGNVYLVNTYARGIYHPADLGTTVATDEWAWRGAYPTSPGDVNDDGLADVGFVDRNRQAAVIFGRADLPDTLDLLADQDLYLYCDSPEYNDGVTDVAALGDWDGDGDGDFAVANEGWVREEDRVDGCDYVGCSSGGVFLIAGPRMGGTIDLANDVDRIEPDDPLYTYPGFGRHISGGVDVDEDGFPDLAIVEDEYRAFILFGGGAY